MPLKSVAAVALRRSQFTPPASIVRVFLFLAGLAFYLGCASTASTGAVSIQERLEKLPLHRTVLPFAVDLSLQEWVKKSVSPRASERETIRVLVDRLLGTDGLGIRYERDFTATAREVFDTGKANCLAFTNLFVGLARELKIPVYFIEVRDLQSYEKEDDLIVHSEHIAVGYGAPHEMTLIDFSTEQGASYRQIRIMDDREAVALYYSNRGAESLRAGNPYGALEWLEDAVRIAPETAGAWVNLGVAQRRTSQLALAEASYRRALEADSRAGAAYQNLAVLLRLRGEDEEAAAYLELSRRAERRNPYSWVALGDLSLRRGRLEEAERYYRRAIRVDGEQAEPLAALGLLTLTRGDEKGARRLLRKARVHDAHNSRVTELAERLTGNPG